MNHVHKSIAFRLLSNTISKSDDFQSCFSSNMTGTTSEAGLLTSLEHPNSGATYLSGAPELWGYLPLQSTRTPGLLTSLEHTNIGATYLSVAPELRGYLPLWSTRTHSRFLIRFVLCFVDHCSSLLSFFFLAIVLSLDLWPPITLLVSFVQYYFVYMLHRTLQKLDSINNILITHDVPEVNIHDQALLFFSGGYTNNECVQGGRAHICQTRDISCKS